MHGHSLIGAATRLAAITALIAVSEVRAEVSGSAPIGQTQSAAQAAYYNKQICKKEQVTGSNIPRRVCRTQAQIDSERAAAQKLMKDANSQVGRETAPHSLSANPMR